MQSRRLLVRSLIGVLAVAAVLWSTLAPSNWSYWLSLIPLIPAFVLLGGWIEDTLPNYSRRRRHLVWTFAILCAVLGSVLYIVFGNNHIYALYGWLALPLVVLSANARAASETDPVDDAAVGFRDGPWGLP